MKTIQLICLVVVIGYIVVIKAKPLTNVAKSIFEMTDNGKSIMEVKKRFDGVSCALNFNNCKCLDKTHCFIYSILRNVM